jgi:type IV secretion system protein VirB2
MTFKTMKSTLSSALATALLAPGLALAEGGGDLAETGATTKKFFDNINGLLNMASISVVTIAVIFAGYQIAFAHKRIADVSPILIGGFLIGAAAQVAKMLIGSNA